MFFSLLNLFLWGVPTAKAEEQSPMFMGGRTSIAVSEGHGSIVTVGGTIGLELDSSGRTACGMRFIYIQNPPENPFEEYTPEVPSAWGPVMDFYFFPNPKGRLSPYVAVSGGFVYGVPTNVEENNVVLPIFELAVGMRFQKKISDKDILYVSPDMGIIPELWIPFVGINFGIKSK